jgi:hypothetical protein
MLKIAVPCGFQRHALGMKHLPSRGIRDLCMRLLATIAPPVPALVSQYRPFFRHGQKSLTQHRPSALVQDLPTGFQVQSVGKAPGVILRSEIISGTIRLPAPSLPW